MRPITLKMQAFGSYAEETLIDFGKTTQNLFWITGDTGAGKTTIFDAMVFALYGKSSSGNHTKEGVVLQSHFASIDKEPYVEFTFAASNQPGAPIYTVRRVPKHMRPLKRASKTGNTQKEETGYVELTMPDGSVYNERGKQDEKIQEIVGLSKEQFMQVAMIAQGEFLELLRAKSDEKKEIFRKLFGTELYSRIAEKLAERKRAADQSCQEIKQVCILENSRLILDENYPQQRELVMEYEKIQNGNLADMDGYLEQLEAFCGYLEQNQLEMKTQVEQDTKSYHLAREQVAKGELLQETFRNLRAAKEQYNLLLEQQASMEEQQALCEKIQSAYRVKPEYDLFCQLDTQQKEMQENLKRESERLPVLKNEWEKVKEMLDEEEQKKQKYESWYLPFCEKIGSILQSFAEQKKIEDAWKNKQKEYENLLKKDKQLEEEMCHLQKEQEIQQQVMEETQQAQAERVDLQAKLEQLVRRNKEYDALVKLRKKIVREQKLYEKMQEGEYQEANENWNQKKVHADSLQQLFLNSQAGILARTLQPGCPCIVCGSTTHPSPYTFSETEEPPTKEAVDSAQKACDAAYSLVNEIANRLSEKRTTLQLKVEEYQRTILELSKDVLQEETVCPDSKEEIVNSKWKQWADEKEQKLCNALEKEQQELQQKLDAANEKVKKWEVAVTFVKEAEQKRKKLEKSKENLRKQQTECLEEKTRMESSLEEMKKFTSEFSSKEEAEKKKKEADNGHQNLCKQLEEEKRKEEEKRQAKHACETLVQTYQEKLPEMEKQCTKAKDTYVETAKKQGFQDGEQSWLTLLSDYSRESLKEMQQQLTTYRENCLAYQTQIETATKTIGDQEEPDMEALLSERQAWEEKYHEGTEKLNRMVTMSKTNRDILQRLVESYADRREKMRKWAKINRLHEAIAGKTKGSAKMDLETYVQRYYLKRILADANSRFEKLSGGQFHLCIKDVEESGNGRNEGLDLMVYSLVTGKRREVKTLSGGESFMAALSLALGMADQIKANSSAIQLDMMFIDEGFGSLDEHARGQAVKVLKEMAGSDKLIGIISHVSELKQEIDNQLVITKNEKGSHVRWVQ